MYYIILDAYGRKDTLCEIYKFNNAPFLEELETMGFYVASCSQSNYAQTDLSLSSSLNFAYLQDLLTNFAPGSTDRPDLWPLIKHNSVNDIFLSMGYTTIAFETGFYWADLRDTDVFLSLSTTLLQKWRFQRGLNDFEVLLIKTTSGLIIVDGLIKIPSAIHPHLDNPRKIHRERILSVLGELEQMPNYPSPKFVFAHIVCPHAPFVFGPNGEWIASNEAAENETSIDRYARGYRDQIIYLDKQLVEILYKIITSSDPAPIIVLQADHGPSEGYDDIQYRMNILNAYYLPKQDSQSLYKAISPVSTFRLVLNSLFEADLPLLEDQSYYSTYNDPYSFILVPNQCNP